MWRLIFCVVSITLVLCGCLLVSGVEANVEDAINRVKSQIHAFQNGGSVVARDSSGLIYPPNRNAVRWLEDFKAEQNRENSRKESWRPKQYSNPCRRHTLASPLNGTESSVNHTNVLIVPVGHKWKSDKWLDRPDDASFDIIALYYGDDIDEFRCPSCKAVYPMKGPAWRLYYNLTSGNLWKSIARRYQYVMLPDDDLEFSTCSINNAFDVMQRYDLLLGQPSVCHGNNSGTWRPRLQQRIQYEVRFTNFVEIMCPIFRMDFFDHVVRWTLSKHWTYVGWGLDSVWPALLGYPEDRIGIIDSMCMLHPPTPGGLGNAGKEDSIYAPGLSPFNPKEEEAIVFKAFNYTQKTLKAMGQDFMPFRITSGVLNEGLVATMTDTLGEHWPNPKMSFEFGYISPQREIVDADDAIDSKIQNDLSDFPYKDMLTFENTASLLQYSFCLLAGVLLGRISARRKLRNRDNSSQ